MSFWPILEREMRVRARGRANYWSRLAVALAGTLIAAPPLLWADGPFATPPQLGRTVFNGIVTAAFILCCASCLVTADTISRERREGTLGLLFLTRIKSLDVLTAKFASNGLACLLMLVAFVPVLTLPVLAGGVGPAEVARKALVLLNVMFLALSAGLWSSARGFDRVATIRDATFVVIALVLGPLLVSLMFPGNSLELASPLGAMLRASAASYRITPRPFWVSIAVAQAVSWMLLINTVLTLRKRPQLIQEPTGGDARNAAPLATQADAPPFQKCSYCGARNGEEATHCYSCGTQLWVNPGPDPIPIHLADQPTPIHWLLRRRPGLPPIVWLAGLIGLFHILIFSIAGRLFRMGGYGAVGWAMSTLTSAVTGALFAWAASRYFVNARRSGELELLLPTPLGAETIVPAQWNVLKRLITGPLVLMILPLAGQWLLSTAIYQFGADQTWKIYFMFAPVLGAINVVLSARALCWVGLWFGLRTGILSRAVVLTVVLVSAPPHVLSLLCAILSPPLMRVFGGPVSPLSWLFNSLVPAAAAIWYYLWLTRLARRQLRHELSGAEPLPFRLIIAESLSRFSAAVRSTRDGGTPSPA